MNDRNTRERTFNLGSDDREEVTHYCHVGITLCSYLSSEQRTVNMCAKGSNILSAMTGIGVKRNGIHPMEENMCAFHITWLRTLVRHY